MEEQMFSRASPSPGVEPWIVSDLEPSFLRLDLAEIEDRAREALGLLGEERCVVCPRLCKVGRLLDERGLCAIGRQAVVASHFPHFGEENCLRGWNGSGTIFFSGCNLRCVFCVAPQTLIATDRGITSIEQIFDQSSNEVRLGEGYVRRPTDLVVHTVDGQLAPASKVFKHHHRGELVCLKPLNGPELRVTANHRVFAAHRSKPDVIFQIPAGDLSKEHYLVIPKRSLVYGSVELDIGTILAAGPPPQALRRRPRIEQPRLLAALESASTSAVVGRQLGYHPAYVRTLRSRLRRGLWDGGGNRPLPLLVEDGRIRFSGERKPGIPRQVPLDNELAWLLGLYCAEGHVCRYAGRPNSFRLILSFGRHEEALADRASRVLRRTFDVQTQLVQRATTITVEAGKSSLAILFKRLCGSGARVKRVPAPVFGAPEEVVRAFLDGYLAGDGTFTRSHLVGTTASPELAHGLFELGLRMNVLPSIHGWRPAPHKTIEGRRVRQSPLWFVKFKRDRLEGRDLARERSRWKDAGSHFLVPIYRMKREPYDGPVYNLEVDHPTRSYLAPAVAIGNCQNHDISWEVQGERVTPVRLAEMMLEVQGWGCHNVNFVTPEHVVPQILEALPHAIAGGLRLPIVYNTSSYDSLDSLLLMDGIVDVYMPDFKVWTAEAARRYLRRPDYAEVARQTVKEMNRQVGPLFFDDSGLARRGLLLRHLVMPGMLDETEAILRFVAEELGPDTYVDLMAQYYPAGLVGKGSGASGSEAVGPGKGGRDSYEEIDRHLWREEYLQALEMGRSLGLRRLDARSAASAEGLEPSASHP